MLGSLDFFKQNDYKIKSYSTYFNWHAQSLTDNDVIVFSGGGNFGDIHKCSSIASRKNNTTIC
jgi:exopolysaccharide biosynthesis predicted pyruvyltransferase EpsI